MLEKTIEFAPVDSNGNKTCFLRKSVFSECLKILHGIQEPNPKVMDSFEYKGVKVICA